MKNNYNIDAHSHICYETEEYIIGANYRWPIIPTLKNYRELAVKNNIGITLFSPCTSPEIINKKDGTIERFIVWYYINGDFKYYSEFVDSEGKSHRKKLNKNPYKKINDLLFDYLSKYQNYYFVPAINLMYDTPEYIYELIMKGAIAFKCHGISIGLDNFDKINKRILMLLAMYDIPLVIHTDYSENKVLPIEQLYIANSPDQWINLLRQYDVRGYLVHGCRLSEECSEILEKNKDQFITGMAPDLLLQKEQERLFMSTDNYLKTLLSMYSEDVLAFDIDYGWNIKNRNSQELDMEQIDRLEKLICSGRQRQKILRKNSERFFKVGKYD